MAPQHAKHLRRSLSHGEAGFLDSAADLDLFALRAVANQPLHVLARISPDPAGAWRRKDVDVVRRLAALELQDAGLVLPRQLKVTAARSPSA